MSKQCKRGRENCPNCRAFLTTAFHVEKYDTNNPHGFFKYKIWYNCGGCGTVFTVGGIE